MNAKLLIDHLIKILEQIQEADVDSAEENLQIVIAELKSKLPED